MAMQLQSSRERMKSTGPQGQEEGREEGEKERRPAPHLSSSLLVSAAPDKNVKGSDGKRCRKGRKWGRE